MNICYKKTKERSGILKKYFFITLLCLSILTGCASKTSENQDLTQAIKEESEDQISIKSGEYRAYISEGVLSVILNFKADSNILSYEIVGTSSLPPLYEYEIKGNQLIAKGGEKDLFFAILDNETLKLRDLIFHYQGPIQDNQLVN